MASINRDKTCVQCETDFTTCKPQFQQSQEIKHWQHQHKKIPIGLLVEAVTNRKCGDAVSTEWQDKTVTVTDEFILALINSTVYDTTRFQLDSLRHHDD